MISVNSSLACLWSLPLTVLKKDTSAYLLASSIQHHPEPFPRTAEDGPITSSNRSLGFTLSNNGYDVWLIPTRGSNKQNLGHTKNALGINVVHDGGNSANLTKGEIAYEYARTPFYWQYGQDDVLAFELKPQWDKVLEVTGSQEFSLYSYSLSTPTTLGFLAMHPDYASRVRVYFQMGPAIAASHFTGFDFTYFEIICNAVPTRGVGFTPTFIGNPLLRELFVDLSPSYEIRYTLLKEITRLIFGPSPKYQTNLERNALDKIFKPVSFKTVQQYCQNSVSKVFQKFNYGLGNLGIYGSVNPPAYNISYVDVQNYVIVNGEYDGLASPETVKHLISMVSARKPIEQIEAPQFNHLDLITGVECDKYVNLPVLETLNKYSN